MIIQRGTYKNLNWYITETEVGIKCAYVAMPEHKFAKLTSWKPGTRLSQQYDIVDEVVSVHGGCTYLDIGLRVEDGRKVEPRSIMIGWDYGHGNDVILNLKATTQPLKSKATLDEVRQEVFQAIDEIAAHVN